MAIRPAMLCPTRRRFVPEADSRTLKGLGVFISLPRCHSLIPCRVSRSNVSCAKHELVVEAAEADADQAADILARGMRKGFEAVFGDLPNYEDVARYVVGRVERGPTWGGKRFDQNALSELDKEILFKGLDEDHDDEDHEDDDDGEP
jgi:hypothetical protein